MNQLETASLLEMLEYADTKQALIECGQKIIEGGYSPFSAFLYQFEQRMKQAGDADMGLLEELIRRGKQALPDPGAISPAWEKKWERLEGIAEQKSQILKSVAPDKREGEWQIIIDNPFSLESVSCHPGLDFYQAAYYFGYFMQDLKKNEFLRLQRIENIKTIFQAEI